MPGNPNYSSNVHGPDEILCDSISGPSNSVWDVLKWSKIFSNIASRMKDALQKYPGYLTDEPVAGRRVAASSF